MSIGISKEIESIIIGLNNKIDIDLSNTDLLDNGKINNKYTKSNIPIGYLYIQLPNQESPDILFGGNWNNISNECMGKFLRIEGGNAISFGNSQNNGLPNITGVLAFRGGDIGTSANVDASDFNKINGAFKSVQKIQWYDGKDNHKGYPEIDTSYGGYIDFNASRVSSIYQDGITEVRPENITVRIWKRTA